MNLTKTFAAVALVALPAATYGSGCSSSSTKNYADGGGSGGSGSGSSGGGTSGSSSSSSSSSGGGSSGGGACTPACPTQCTKELCATPRANTTVGSPCDVCASDALSLNGVCNTPVSAACTNDPDCVALVGVGGCLDGCDMKVDGGVPTDNAGADQSCFNSDAGAAVCATCCVRAHSHGTATIDTALVACACCH